MHWLRSRISAMRNQRRVMSCVMTLCVYMHSCVRVMRRVITVDGGGGARSGICIRFCASRGIAFRKQRSACMSFI
jgi:hypothetical protein